MFTESAEFYDLIYSFKDYEKEAGQIGSMIKEWHPNAESILDIGCGTGEHHPYLKQTYEIDGLDINPTFLDAARNKNPDGNYFHKNMEDFSLGKKYDVVLCLFSSIGYVLGEEKLCQTMSCFAQHIKDDGLVIIEPWITPDQWYDGKLHMLTYETDDIKICRMNLSKSEGDLSIIHFHYLVGTKDEDVRHFDEVHRVALRTDAQMREAIEAAGLHAHYDSGGLIGRGMYLCRKN